MVAVAARGGGDPGERPAGEPAPSDASARDPTTTFRRLGVVVRRPPGWTSRTRGGVARLRSPDRTMGVTIVSAGPQRSPAEVLRDLERALRTGPLDARVVERREGRLAGLPARVATLTGSGRGPLDLLVLVARSRWRTHGVTVYSGRGAPQPRVEEARALLASIGFVRPQR